MHHQHIFHYIPFNAPASSRQDSCTTQLPQWFIADRGGNLPARTPPSRIDKTTRAKLWSNSHVAHRRQRLACAVGASFGLYAKHNERPVLAMKWVLMICRSALKSLNQVWMKRKFSNCADTKFSASSHFHSGLCGSRSARTESISVHLFLNVSLNFGCRCKRRVPLEFVFTLHLKAREKRGRIWSSLLSQSTKTNKGGKGLTKVGVRLALTQSFRV